MTPRSAHSCFLLGVRVERATAVASLLSAARTLRIDGYRDPDALGRAVARAAGAPSLDGAWEDRLLWDLLLPSSVSTAVYEARREARQARDSLAGELWSTLNGLYAWLWNEARAAYDAEPEAVYDEVRARCLQFHGEQTEAHLRDSAFHALRLGAATERARATARLVAAWSALPAPPPDASLADEASPWPAALRACGTTGARGLAPTGAGAAAFLLSEPAFPRSVAAAAARATSSLAALPLEQGEQLRDAANALRALHEEGGAADAVAERAESACSLLETALAAEWGG